MPRPRRGRHPLRVQNGRYAGNESGARCAERVHRTGVANRREREADGRAALLKVNAVVGVKGIFQGDRLTSLGITCAFCHSTVDDSFAPGIGKRLDGWPNRDLNVGAIVSLAPDLSPLTKLLGVDEAMVKKLLASWGPGKYDAVVVSLGVQVDSHMRRAASTTTAGSRRSGPSSTTTTRASRSA